jgi:hypothetical protein
MRRLLPAVLVLGAACGGLRTPGSSDLELPATLDFGDLPVGPAVTLEVPVHWRGSRRALLVLSPPSDAAFEVEQWRQLEPGERFALPVVFRARTPGAVRATFDLVADREKRRIELRARAVPDALKTAPLSLDFGTVPPGGTSALLLPIESQVDVELSVYAVAVESDGGAFRASGVTLGPRQAGAIPVSFGPSCTRAYTGKLAVSCPGCVPFDVDLAGDSTGWLHLDPPALDLGLVPPGTWVTGPAQVTNLGCVAHEITVAIEPSTSGFRTYEGRRFVDPGESAALEVGFLAAEQGPHAASLVVRGDGAEVRTELTAAVSGPRMVADPIHVDLGTFTQADAPEATIVVTTTEPGSTRVASVTAGPALAIAPDRSLPAELGAGPLRVTVRTEPGDPGAFSGVVEIQPEDQRLPRLQVPVVGRRVEGGPCDLEVPDRFSVGLQDCNPRNGVFVPIRNVGTTACAVWNARVEQDAQSFFEVGASLHLIAPGTTWQLPLSFNGGLCHAEQVRRGTLLLDHARGQVRIPLVGETAYLYTYLDVSEAAGSVGRYDPVRLFVASVRDLAIDGIEVSAPGLFLTRPPRHVVSSTYALDLPLSFSPEEPGAGEGLLAVHLAGHPEPYLVPVRTNAGAACEGCRPKASCPTAISGEPGSRFLLRGEAGGREGAAATCTWSIAAEPAAGAGELAAAGTCDAVLRTPLAGEYVARLDVRAEDDAASCETPLSIAPVSTAVHLEAGWSLLADDVDLHVFGGGITAAPAPESWFGDECRGAHCEDLFWGVSTARFLRHDDPELPYEEVALDSSAPTSWVVGVHRAVAGGDAPLEVTLRWICGDATGSEALTLSGGEAAMVQVDWDGAACRFTDLPDRYVLARP